MHQRQHRFAEELEIRREVEERDLDPVAPGPLEPDQLVDHVLGAADDLDVAAERAVLVAVRLPGDRVARPLMRDEAFDRAMISRIEDRLVISLRLAVGLAADDHRVYDRAQLPAALGAGGFDGGVVRGQSCKRRVDLVPGRAGDEDEVGMRRGIVDAGREPVALTSTGARTRLRRDECLLEDQNLPCSVRSSDAPQSRQRMSVNSPAIS